MKRYLLAGLVAMAAVPLAAQVNFTVGPPGSGATHFTLGSAVTALDKTEGPEPNRITFIDEGPFMESVRIVINVARTGPRELIIEAQDGLRPVLWLGDGVNRDAGFHLRKQFGGITIRDLIIIPQTNPDVVADAAILIMGDDVQGTSVTLENLLISSNDGNNQPIASLDGLTPPVVTPDTVSFNDEGIFIPSSAVSASTPHNITIRDVVVSGLDGRDGSDGIRSQGDGPEGSLLTIGPGVTVSYLMASRPNPFTTTTLSAFQPGGKVGYTVNLLGTQEKPIRLINNNGAGIGVTHQAGTGGVDHMEWVIIANNRGAGIANMSRDSETVMENVTIVNNRKGGIVGPPLPDGLSFDLSNVILAGNGDPADLDNVVILDKTSQDAPGALASFTAADSAIVLNGPYTFNTNDFGGDGIRSDETYDITLTNITNLDPQFASLDPTNAGFVQVQNQAFATAGPGGTVLVGGGTFNNSSVGDWSVY